MKILVTGASGFAGSHLVEALLAAGHKEVYGTAYGRDDYLRSLLPTDQVIAIDLTKADDVKQLILNLKPDWIFHLASLAFVGKSFERASELFTNNFAVQLNMLESVRLHAPKARLLTIGSAEEYGMSEAGEIPIHEDHPLRPINPYAVSKVAQDLLAYSYAVSYKLNVIRARPFNHIGERQTEDFAIPAFAKQIVEIERGKSDALHVGNLKSVRDFTDVKDMVRAYILLMEKGEVGEPYNIGSGIGTSMEKVVKQLISLSKSEIHIEQDSTRLRPHDIPEIIAGISRMKKLGWSPAIPLEQSLNRVLEYWREKNNV
ncbi:MAG TPA: GDP-mannose 4,6-dehydratase [Candidatus Saccharimonadia bacterium]|nr:GDP-mannose 4,6-dehydratase [Candidatus Saccharimonadia bacterium]